MTRRRWMVHAVASSLAFRKGRSLLLVGVLALAASLVTALGSVSSSMEERVAEEVRKYGSNLVMVPDAAPHPVGFAGLDFGKVAEPAYLEQDVAEAALARGASRILDHSLHLRGTLALEGRDLPVEGVVFPQVRRLSPWWQVKGSWPREGEGVLGSSLARQLRVSPGDLLELSGSRAKVAVKVAGIVSTGGDEDALLYLDLPKLQEALGLAGKVTSVKVQASGVSAELEAAARLLQGELHGGKVREVRQVARTSATLLKKVQILMLLVAAVVIVTSGGSVAGTMSTTVIERSKEIGLLKAMGGSRRSVLFLFAAEALAVGTAGGVAGFLVGNAIACMVMHTVFGGGWQLIPWLLPAALAVSLLLACAGSLGPMLSVYRLDPVRSLRGE